MLPTCVLRQRVKLALVRCKSPSAVGAHLARTCPMDWRYVERMYMKQIFLIYAVRYFRYLMNNKYRTPVYQSLLHFQTFNSTVESNELFVQVVYVEEQVILKSTKIVILGASQLIVVTGTWR